MSLEGLTVKDLLEAKGKRQIAYVQVAREEEAAAAAEAGMDMIGTAFIPERAHFAQAAKGTHFQFGLPWGKHANSTEALRDAMAAMNAGAQSIYCGMSPKTVEYLANEGVPVICHLGLVPPKATWTGGYRAVGRTAGQAANLWQQLKDFENAGAFAVELEVVAADLAAEFTTRTSLLTISLGSGDGCDAQYLFSADILGENRGHIPRHAKVYRNFAAERDRLQQERVSAYREYISDVQNGAFPEETHVVQMRDGELAAFLDKI
ncbi:MAG: 3-methyl-2-oxobutanoate hydroxymethyltransferase [Pseudomonadota bacterium]